jgi:hypothetical protein
MISSKNSPKKKKKHQKINSTYVVVREVITVNWNLYNIRQFKLVRESDWLKNDVSSWKEALKFAYQ